MATLSREAQNRHQDAIARAAWATTETGESRALGWIEQTHMRPSPLFVFLQGGAACSGCGRRGPGWFVAVRETAPEDQALLLCPGCWRADTEEVRGR